MPKQNSPARPHEEETPRRDVSTDDFVSDGVETPRRDVSTAPPDGAPVIDPMADAFGPGSGVSPGGVYHDPAEDNDAPEELLYAFAEHGLADKSYRCMVKQISGESGNPAVVSSFSNTYPSLDWMKKNIGPGEYKLVFMWRTNDKKDLSGNKKHAFKTQDIPVSISEKCRNEYVEYQFDKRLETFRKNRQKLQDAKLEKTLELQLGDIDLDGTTKAIVPKETTDPETYVQKTLDMARKLGFGPQNALQPANQGLQWDKILPVLIPAIPMIMKMFTDSADRRDQQNQQMITLLTSMSNNSNSQLVELVKAQQGPTNGQQMMKEYTDMVRSAFDLKAMMQPEKESLADKLFKLAEIVAPQVLSVLALKNEQRVADPRYNMAQSFMTQNPDFNALRANPAELQKFIAHLDEFYGWEQADQILAVGKFERTTANPRVPEQRYPQGDPRNDVGAGLAPTQEAEIETPEIEQETVKTPCQGVSQ